MKAVLLVGGFSTQMRPITMSLPLPLIEFCNVSLLEHQLRALKDAGVSEVLILVHERVVPATFDEYVKKCESELGLRISCAKEEGKGLGTAGPLKAAESMIMDGADEGVPFIVVNSDVLCTYPLRDLLHLHIKHARACTLLTTRCTDQSHASRYGACVIDERTGRVRHFVDRPQTCAPPRAVTIATRPRTLAGAGACALR